MFLFSICSWNKNKIPPENKAITEDLECQNTIMPHNIKWVKKQCSSHLGKWADWRLRNIFGNTWGYLFETADWLFEKAMQAKLTKFWQHWNMIKTCRVEEWKWYLKGSWYFRVHLHKLPVILLAHINFPYHSKSDRVEYTTGIVYFYQCNRCSRSHNRQWFNKHYLHRYPPASATYQNIDAVRWTVNKIIHNVSVCFNMNHWNILFS